MRRILVVSVALTALTASAACSRQVKVFDRPGKEIGEVIRWDDRFASQPLNATVRYQLAGGGDVALIVAPESIIGTHMPGGSQAIFTTSDCSGNDMFAQVPWPPLTRRYGMVLPAAANGSMVHIHPDTGWLWVTDELPARVNPGATVFHSQWTESGTCSAYPPAGLRRAGQPVRRLLDASRRGALREVPAPVLLAVIAGRLRRRAIRRLRRLRRLRDFADGNCGHAADGRKTPGPPAASGRAREARGHITGLPFRPAGL